MSVLRLTLIKLGEEITKRRLGGGCEEDVEDQEDIWKSFG